MLTSCDSLSVLSSSNRNGSRTKIKRKKFSRAQLQQEEMFLKNSSLKRPTDTNETNEIQPHENDVLMGRGGKNNQHIGNEKLRELARQRWEDYNSATKKAKSQMSKELVQMVRNLDPPGRFLDKNRETSQWEDVGEDRAREKTSQVLRDAVQNQKFGPDAKQRHRIKDKPADTIGEEGSRAATNKDRGLMKGQTHLGQTNTSPPTGSTIAKEDHRAGDSGARSTIHGVSATAPSSIHRAFSPAWHPPQQRELKADDQHFWPGSPGTFDQQRSSIPPPYLGIMRDPGSSNASSSVSSGSFQFYPTQQQRNQRSQQSSFHIPSVTPAASIGAASTSSATAMDNRKRPRHFESPQSSPSYYGLGHIAGNAVRQYEFSSPREQHYAGQVQFGSSRNTSPSIQTNTSPMIITSTPPFTANMNMTQNHFANSFTPASAGGRASSMVVSQPSPQGRFPQQHRQQSQNYNYTSTNTNMLCSPHNASSQHLSPPNVLQTTYFPGAKFATANSPGSFSQHTQLSPFISHPPPPVPRPPERASLSSSSSSAQGASSIRSSRQDPWPPASMVGRTTSFAGAGEASAATARALLSAVGRENTTFEQHSRLGSNTVARPPNVGAPFDFLQEDAVSPQQQNDDDMALSDTEREGAISPFPFSTLKLEDQEEL